MLANLQQNRKGRNNKYLPFILPYPAHNKTLVRAASGNLRCASEPNYYVSSSCHKRVAALLHYEARNQIMVWSLNFRTFRELFCSGRPHLPIEARLAGYFFNSKFRQLHREKITAAFSLLWNSCTSWCRHVILPSRPLRRLHS